MTTTSTPDDQPRPEEGELIPEANTGNNVRASWNFSLHDIRVNMAHCTPERKETMISAFLWCIDPAHPLHIEEFAAKVDYSKNTIYKVFTGKHISPETKKRYDVPEDLYTATKQWLDRQKEFYIGGKTEFVMTPTARRIYTACDLARESRTPVFLYGGSHIGKTWALEHYKDHNNHGSTAMIRVKAAAGLGGLVKRLATALGVSEASNTAALVDRVKNALAPSMVLIVDELHQLMYTYRRASFFACLEVIREIYDEVHCGMVLSGTQLLMDKINQGRKGEMEQLLRRGVHRVNLGDHPTRADVEAILAHWRLDMPAKRTVIEVQGIQERPYDLLRQLADNDGLLSITERLRYAQRFGKREHSRLSWEHFVLAHLTIKKQSENESDWS